MSKTLRAFGINCTLKSTPAASSTQKILDQLLQELQSHEIETSFARIVDHDVKPGVKTNEGEGDAWPALRKQVLDANILVFATPIWMGQPSSVAKRVLERMDAFLDEIDENGCYPTFGRVAIVAVVGNEDGAHHVTAELYQALADVGFTIPGGSSAYWVGEAMGSVNYIVLE
jgi:multimeric flavodoxin WrbA